MSPAFGKELLNTLHQAPPPVCLPYVYMYLTSLHLMKSPRLSPSIFHVLTAIKYWRPWSEAMPSSFWEGFRALSLKTQPTVTRGCEEALCLPLTSSFTSPFLSSSFFFVSLLSFPEVLTQRNSSIRPGWEITDSEINSRMATFNSVS